MYYFLAALFSIVFVLSGCEHSVLAEPSVIYKNDDQIEVKYLTAGIKTAHNEGQAIEIIKAHCGEDFDVERTSSGNANYLKAKCE